MCVRIPVKAGVRTQVSPSIALSPVLLIQSLTEPGAHPWQLDGLAMELQDPPVSTFSALGSQACAAVTGFMWGPGIELRNSGLVMTGPELQMRGSVPYLHCNGCDVTKW